LNGLGTVAFAVGEYAEARWRFEDALDTARDTGNLWQSCVALVGLGNVACVLGELERSRQYLPQALEDTTKSGMRPTALSALVGLAHLSAEEGDPDQAVELLALAFHHPASAQVMKDRAQDLLTRLESELPPEAFAEAMERGRARDLEATVQGLLSELEATPDGR